MTGGSKVGISTFIESAKVSNAKAVREVEQDPVGALRRWVDGGVTENLRVGDIGRGKGLAVEAVAQVDEEPIIPSEPDLTRFLVGIDTTAAVVDKEAGADAVRFLFGIDTTAAAPSAAVDKEAGADVVRCLLFSES